MSAPGDEVALRALTERLWRRRLDRSRPLWRMWFVTGLDDGRVGVVVVLHHALADGLTAMRMVRSLLEPPLSAEDTLRAGGCRRDASAGVDRSRARQPPIHDRLGPMARRPCHVAARRRGRSRRVAGLIPVPRSPRTSLNAPVGPRRRLATLRLDLAAANGWHAPTAAASTTSSSASSRAAFASFSTHAGSRSAGATEGGRPGGALQPWSRARGRERHRHAPHPIAVWRNPTPVPAGADRCRAGEGEAEPPGRRRAGHPGVARTLRPVRRSLDRPAARQSRGNVPAGSAAPHRRPGRPCSRPPPDRPTGWQSGALVRGALLRRETHARGAGRRRPVP